MGPSWLSFGGLQGSPGVLPTDVSLEQLWGARCPALRTKAEGMVVAAAAGALPLHMQRVW